MAPPVVEDPPPPAAGGGTDPITGWPTVEQAEDQIHASMNMANINDPSFYTEANKAWHPLKHEWAETLEPLSAPDPPTVAEKCMMDCREREKLRKRECAEIRKRVQAKLKDLGCPSTVKSTDKATLCGSKKSKKETPVKKKRKNPKNK